MSLAMEEDDDLFLVIVENESSEFALPIMIKQEPEYPEECDVDVNDIINTAEKHGQLLNMNLEPAISDCEYQEPKQTINDNEILDNLPTAHKKCTVQEEYTLQDNEHNMQDKENNPHNKEYVTQNTIDSEAVVVKEEEYAFEDEEYIVQDEEDIFQDEEYLTQDVDCNILEENHTEDEHKVEKIRKKMLDPKDQRSFVKDLQEEYPELRSNRKKLINTLCEIMRNVQVPTPPDDYYVQDGVDIFICTKCGGVTESLPAAGRHYQEKHGPRYLICYACGVDFRSTTNLYKHEKRCSAPDANIVLRARAICLGNKGRSRPYLHLRKIAPPTVEQNKFQCRLCSAKFISKEGLNSHEYMHRGVRPFQCHTCPAAYTSSSALLRHMKKHSNEQYVCHHCSRMFKVKAALVAHLHTHELLRKHACPECSRRFAQKSAMQLHLDRVHRLLPPPCACQLCPKRYPRMSLLKTHMKNEHGFVIMTRKMFFKKLPMLTADEVEQYAKLVFKSDVTQSDESNPFSIDCTQNNTDNDDGKYIMPNDLSSQDFMEYLKKLQYKDTEGTEAKVFVIKNGRVTNLKTEIDDLDY